MSVSPCPSLSLTCLACVARKDEKASRRLLFEMGQAWHGKTVTRGLYYLEAQEHTSVHWFWLLTPSGRTLLPPTPSIGIRADSVLSDECRPCISLFYLCAKCSSLQPISSTSTTAITFRPPPAPLVLPVHLSHRLASTRHNRPA